MDETQTITPERAISIVAPPGSILLFFVNPATVQAERAHFYEVLTKRLPEYRILVLSTDVEDIRAIVTEPVNAKA